MAKSRHVLSRANMALSSPAAKRLFIVEDEALVAMLMEDMLTDLGHEVSAIASRLHHAYDIARTGVFDLAILDVNLDGQPSYLIAETLRERGVPFAFATGYGGMDSNTPSRTFRRSQSLTLSRRFKA